MFAIAPLLSLSKNLQATFSYATFFAPLEGPYVETYLKIMGSSAKYVQQKNGQYQAAIEISVLYNQGETPKYFDKYNLLSPEIKDTLTSFYNFTDLKRVSLPKGNYNFILTIKDKNEPNAKPFELKQDISLDYMPNVIAISDIELLDSYKASVSIGALEKNGVELNPLISNYFSKENNSLKFYTEIYNTSSILDKDLFLLNYHIENFETKKPLDNFSNSSRQISKPVSILLTEIDISELPSGNFNLVVEARNRNNELLAKKGTFFQRSAKIANAGNGENLDFRTRNINNTFAAQITNKDSLTEYINSLYPISSPDENTFAINQLELQDLHIMQQYFYDFWIKRNSENPGKGWIEYKIQVDKANAFYHALNKKGYRTDRGRVFLQYGPPNSVSESYNETNSYPYEIWQYYKAKNETNKKFVFYNPELATNDFKLLHSDAKGEVYERQWQYLLRLRSTPYGDIDDNKPKSQPFGTKADDLFTSPK